VKYEQVCPVSLASEVIAERWTPLILREIVLFDRHHFSEIQRGVGRISQSLLVARLRRLESEGVLERRPNPTGRGWEYHPTPAGRELETVLNELGIWAQHWIELRQEDCDAAYLMQTVHAVLRPERLPHGPVTVRFEFIDQAKPYWLVIDGPRPELCYYDPGRDEDLVVRVDGRAFGSVILGRTRFADAVEAGAIRMDGRPDLVRSFPGWLGPTRFARYATPGVTPA
jgi:DNA-binding HxlR family transcriptional regulator